MHTLKIFSVIALLFILNSAFADDVNNTTPQNTVVNNTAENNAKTWGLTLDEWNQYQKLIQGKSGKWYPQLTPAAILGLNAQTPQEQQHFAEMVAKEEHDKLANELSFNNAVHQAMLKLYVNEPVIKPFDMSPYNPASKMPYVHVSPQNVRAHD
jgi:integrating conjugative element protein (TIGR03759 family)